ERERTPAAASAEPTDATARARSCATNVACWAASRPACRAGAGAKATPMPVDRTLLAGLAERERARFRLDRPRSLKQLERSRASLLSGVPMNWMTRWVGDFPI